MSLDPSFVSLLACPKCKGKLEEKEENSLSCEACQIAFPVIENIPRLILEKATPLEKKG